MAQMTKKTKDFALIILLSVFFTPNTQALDSGTSSSDIKKEEIHITVSGRQVKLPSNDLDFLGHAFIPDGLRVNEVIKLGGHNVTTGD